MAVVLLTASVSSCFYSGHACLKLNPVCGGWREHRVKAGSAVEYISRGELAQCATRKASVWKHWICFC